MRLFRLLATAAALGALAGAAAAQTVTPMTIKDGVGSGNPQPLCEYKPDGTNFAGCTVKWVWNGSAWVLEPADTAGHPVVTGPCTKYKAVNIAASGTTMTIFDTGITPTSKIHVCAILLDTAVAQAMSITEGTTTSTPCDTSCVAVVGSTTASATVGLQLFAGQAFSHAAGLPFLQTQTTGDHLYIVLGVGAGGNALGLLSGYISYSDY